MRFISALTYYLHSNYYLHWKLSFTLLIIVCTMRSISALTYYLHSNYYLHGKLSFYYAFHFCFDLFFAAWPHVPRIQILLRC